MTTMITTNLPADLHAAYEWTDAAGELDQLASLDGDALAEYATASEANARANDVRDVSASDLADLAIWLRSRESRAAS